MKKYRKKHVEWHVKNVGERVNLESWILTGEISSKHWYDKTIDKTIVVTFC